MRPEGVTLKHHARAALVGGEPGHILFIKVDGTSVRLVKAGDVAQQRRLSTSAGAEQEEQLTLADLQIHVIEDGLRAEAFGEALNGDVNHAGRTGGRGAGVSTQMGRVAGRGRGSFLLLLAPPLAELAHLLFVRLGQGLMGVGSLELTLAAEFTCFDDPLLGGLIVTELGDARGAEPLWREGEHTKAEPEVAAHDFEDIAGLQIAAGFDEISSEGDIALRACLGG